MNSMLIKLLIQGMGTTFLVLIIFYFLVRLLVKVFPEK